MSKIKKYLQYALSELRISRLFHQKLGHNFHELTLLEKGLYFCFFRPWWDKRRRFFYEAHFGLPGQMRLAERELLYETIMEHRPRFCLEIGTYTGGGSTFFLTSAFQKLGQGKLFTLEASSYYFNKAKNYYQQKIPALVPFVEFIFSREVRDFSKYIISYKTIDCVFFDGAENGQQTLDQYNYFLPYFTAGTIIMLHDWNTDKTARIKPVLESDPHWKIIRKIGPPESVGLVVIKRL